MPLTLAGPDSQSGTYDFFNEEVLGEDAAGETITPRQDYTASADDNVIVRAVAERRRHDGLLRLHLLRGERGHS